MPDLSAFSIGVAHHQRFSREAHHVRQHIDIDQMGATRRGLRSAQRTLDGVPPPMSPQWVAFRSVSMFDPGMSWSGSRVLCLRSDLQVSRTYSLRARPTKPSVGAHGCRLIQTAGAGCGYHPQCGEMGSVAALQRTACHARTSLTRGGRQLPDACGSSSMWIDVHFSLQIRFSKAFRTGKHPWSVNDDVRNDFADPRVFAASRRRHGSALGDKRDSPSAGRCRHSPKCDCRSRPRPAKRGGSPDSYR